jgi:hypothetical protein
VVLLPGSAGLTHMSEVSHPGGGAGGLGVSEMTFLCSTWHFLDRLVTGQLDSGIRCESRSCRLLGPRLRAVKHACCVLWTKESHRPAQVPGGGRRSLLDRPCCVRPALHLPGQ